MSPRFFLLAQVVFAASTSSGLPFSLVILVGSFLKDVFSFMLRDTFLLQRKDGHDVCDSIPRNRAEMGSRKCEIS